ncbi:sigma-54 dependent transcriptional regulator [bacterium]|nr:sigma-54 dependent transcriptional regulator [bacterium]
MTVILIVDDEPLQRDILKTILDGEGYETVTSSSAEEALIRIKQCNPDVILTDLKMEGMDGIKLLESVTGETFKPAIIIMTAYGTISSAVDAIKKGAFDYLSKPLNKDVLILTIRRAAEHARLVKENQLLKKELYDKFRIDGIVGKSERMKELVEIMRKVSGNSVIVLINGESGTGKELVAKAIHYNSPRKTRPFIALNCAAIPENLFESELFGYEAGAFTGAVARKPGLFEAADGGTLFLDEVADLPLFMQAKLLRVIQEKEIRRLGSKESLTIDVRIITATNRDIEKEMQKGNFREDLYYRLRVVPIYLPPLRERKDDIPVLAEHFIEKYNREFGKRIQGLEPISVNALVNYPWPGNIRQLESVIERAVIMSDSAQITLDDIRGELRTAKIQHHLEVKIPDEGISFEELEKDLLRQAMTKANGVVAKAARLLGMSYKTFWYRWDQIDQ